MATLRQLKYFVEIARSQSLTKAAQSLAVAQPALSQNMATLESELDVKLFQRHAKGVTLTEAGIRLFERSVAILGDVEDLKHCLFDSSIGPQGRVRLSLSGAMASVLAAPLLKQVADRFPGVDLILRDGMSADVMGMLEGRLADLGMMSGAAELPGMEAVPVLQEDFVLLGRPDQVVKFGSNIALDDLLRLPLALPNRSFDLRRAIEREAANNGIKLNVIHEINSLPMLISVATGGLAYTVLPYSACLLAIRAGTALSCNIINPGFSRIQSVVWPENHPLSPSATAVKDCLISTISSLVVTGDIKGRML